MALTWTAEAEEALARAPRILRPLIRRRLESAAKREQRDTIDLEFVMRVKGQEGPSRSETPPPAPKSERDGRINEDILFLAELCEQYCTPAHPDAERGAVLPSGAMARRFDPKQAPLLCADCRQLFLHVAAKRIVCPHDPKPSCRHCTTPCHLPKYRQQMAQIMTWNAERSSPQRND